MRNPDFWWDRPPSGKKHAAAAGCFLNHVNSKVNRRRVCIATLCATLRFLPPDVFRATHIRPSLRGLDNVCVGSFNHKVVPTGLALPVVEWRCTVITLHISLHDRTSLVNFVCNERWRERCLCPRHKRTPWLDSQGPQVTEGNA